MNPFRESAPVLAAIEACERPGHKWSSWHSGTRCVRCDKWYSRLADEENECPGRQPSPRPVVAALLRDVAAGIRVLRTYGVEITEEQVMERARGIVMGLIGNFRIEEETP